MAISFPLCCLSKVTTSSENQDVSQAEPFSIYSYEMNALKFDLKEYHILRLWDSAW